MIFIFIINIIFSIIITISIILTSILIVKAEIKNNNNIYIYQCQYTDYGEEFGRGLKNLQGHTERAFGHTRRNKGCGCCQGTISSHPLTRTAPAQILYNSSSGARNEDLTCEAWGNTRETYKIETEVKPWDETQTEKECIQMPRKAAKC